MHNTKNHYNKVFIQTDNLKKKKIMPTGGFELGCKKISLDLR